MKPWTIVALAACAGLALALPGGAQAQDRAKIRIGTHISISAHLFMQRKPEITKHLGKTYEAEWVRFSGCLLYTSPSPRDVEESRMPSSA